MRPTSIILIISLLVLFTAINAYTEGEETLRGYLTSPDKIDQSLLEKLRDEGYNSVVLDISRIKKDADISSVKDSIITSGFGLYYWIEVGRDRSAVAKNRKWMHRPHKTGFYGGSSVSIYPWVSINNKGVFDYEKDRVKSLILRAGPERALGIFLNDVQSAPEGCGCGNALCRMWDNSEGEKLSGDWPDYFGKNPIAVLRFVEAVESLFPRFNVVPIITEECEAGLEVGGVKDPETTLGYGRMLCSHPDGLETYPTLIKTLSPLKAVGILSLYKVFDRDDPAYGCQAAWVGAILDRYRLYDRDQRLISVIQGWDVTEDELKSQIQQALDHTAFGYIVAGVEIDQSWIVLNKKNIKKI